jgi:hypothetical protein
MQSRQVKLRLLLEGGTGTSKGSEAAAETGKETLEHRAS